MKASDQPPFDAYAGTGPYLFVGYAHEDRRVVYPELERLRRLGFRIWYDEGVHPSSEWPEEIAHAIDNCSFFLVFLSPHAVESTNVKNEIHYAITLHKPFLGVYLENTTLPSGLALQIGSIQAIAKYQMEEDRYCRKLEQAMPSMLKGSPSPDEDEARPGRRRWMIAVATAMVVAALAVALLLFAFEGHESRPAMQGIVDPLDQTRQGPAGESRPPTAVFISITEPRNGDSVSLHAAVRGTVSDDGSDVWVIVNPIPGNEYWVQARAARTGTGHWLAHAQIGRPGNVDIGKRFLVMAIAGPKDPMGEDDVLHSWPEARGVSHVVEVTRGSGAAFGE